MLFTVKDNFVGSQKNMLTCKDHFFHDLPRVLRIVIRPIKNFNLIIICGCTIRRGYLIFDAVQGGCFMNQRINMY